LSIVGESDVARDAVVPALSHLAPDAWPAETPQQWYVAEASETERSDLPRGIYRLGRGSFTMVEHDPFSVESFAPESGIRLVASPAGFASGELRAHPGKLALAAWLAGPTTQVMHTGAVAFAGRAVLLVGPGGVGKSTISLACALAGADFLGDDLCLVEVGAEGTVPQVHSLYATAKLNADSAVRFGAASWPVLGIGSTGKAVVALPPSVRVVRSAPVVAIAVVGSSSGPPCAVAPMRRAQAVAAVAATGGSPCSGGIDLKLWFRIMTRLVQQVPVYGLQRGWDLERVAESVRRIAGAAAPGPPP